MPPVDSSPSPILFLVRRWIPIWGAGFAIATTIAAFNAGSEVVDHLAENTGTPLWEPITWELSSGWSFALLLPFVVELTRRVPFSRERWIRALALHLPVMVAFSAAHVALMVAARKVVYRLIGRTYELGDLRFELPYELLKDVVTYWIVIGMITGWDSWRRARRAELTTARLEVRLAEARLESLQHRLRPHFLFNALNTISATLHRDPAAADEMLAQLSDLLRASLGPGEEPEITLRRELELLEAYLSIMRTRFGDRLDVRLEVDRALLDQPIPPLVLQPLVENAIRHGVGARAGAGLVEVRIGAAEDRCVLEVRDDGPGTSDASRLLSGGLGLGGTAERLEALYGENQSLEAGNLDGGGFRVRIRIPRRRHVAPATSDSAGGDAGSETEP